MKSIKIIVVLYVTALLMTGCHPTINSEKQTTAEPTVQTETELKTEAVDEEKTAKELTKSFDLNNFDQIDISDAIITKVTKGDEFKVEVTTDERMFDYLEVKVEDGMLIAAIKSVKRPKELLDKTVRLDIVCPNLKGLNASDASSITLLSKFEVSDNCKIKLSDSSRFDGEIDSDNLTLDVSDASHAQLDGDFVHDCKINLSDSSAFKGDIHGEDLTLDVNAASSVQLGGDFSRAEIELSNASSADLSETVFDNVDVDVSNASKIKIAANHDINLNASKVSVVTVISGNLVKGDVDKTVSIIKD